MKTAISRFQIHDELTAPEGSVPVLRGALATGGQLPNFLGVLAGSPAALRGYARFRSELRRGTLDVPTLERISLAVAQHHGSQPGLALHARTARQAGPDARRRRPRPRVRLARPERGRRCCATCRPSSRRGPPADAPPRGGARGRLERRAAPRGDRLRRDRVASPRWSTSPATSPSTAPWSHAPLRAADARRSRQQLTSAAPGGGAAGRRGLAARLLSPPPRGGRARRPALTGAILEVLRQSPRPCASPRSRRPSRSCRTGCARSA